MSDNTRLPLGTADGDTYASDDIASVKYQRVKVVLGADGVNSGDVASGNPLPVSAASLPLPSGAATESTLGGVLTTSDFDTKTGSLTETAPATDTASSGTNGRLQRIAQRITSLITALGSPFQAGGSIGNTSFASTVADGADVTLGAKADAKSTATDTTAVTAMSVLKQISASVQAPPSQAVTNTGTFVVQASIAAAQTLSTVTTVGTITNVVHVDDNSGNLSIDDGGNSITVDGTVTATIASGAATIAKAEDLASQDADVGVPAMAVRKATPANTSGSDGDYEMLQISAGRLYVQAVDLPDATSTFAPTNATSTVYATNLVVKGSAGVLYSLTGYNSRTSSQFIQFHNATSLPADTAVPALIFTVPPQSNFSLDFGGKFGRFFSTGIVVCNSSTGPTKTIGAADCWFDVQYA